MPRKNKTIKARSQPKFVHPKRQHSLEAAINAESAYDAGYAAGYADAVEAIRQRLGGE